MPLIVISYAWLRLYSWYKLVRFASASCAAKCRLRCISRKRNGGGISPFKSSSSISVTNTCIMNMWLYERLAFVSVVRLVILHSKRALTFLMRSAAACDFVFVRLMLNSRGPPVLLLSNAVCFMSLIMLIQYVWWCSFNNEQAGWRVSFRYSASRVHTFWRTLLTIRCSP